MTIRDSQIDNAKGILMTLVVLGHLVYPVPNPNTVTEALYLFIYMFHMPMFALVSGYLSHASMDVARLKGEVKKLLVPYAVFIAIQWAILTATGQSTYPLHEGHFGLWFLLSLFCWRLLLPLVMRLPFPLLAAIGAALACGMVSRIGLDFSLSRTFVLLPFFVAGHLMRTNGNPIGGSLRKPVSIIILLAAAAGAFFMTNLNMQTILWGAFSYEYLGMPLWLGPMIRGVHIAAAFACGLAFLAVIPRQPLAQFSRIGRHSLHVYLLHSLLLVLYRTWPESYDPFGSWWFLLIPLSVAVSWFLSSTPVVKATNRLISPLPTHK